VSPSVFHHRVAPAILRSFVVLRAADPRGHVTDHRQFRGASMSVIKPRTRGKQMTRRVVRLDREDTETLCAYAQFLNEPTDYVLSQLIDTVLAKDREFLAWRAEHPESYAPIPVTRPRRSSRRHARPITAAAPGAHTASTMSAAAS
jgi:hypothetical protein